jgi:ribose 1,5-bisphosphate isomerase
VSNDIEGTAAAIRDMSIRGAGKIARAGSMALADFARRYSGTDMERFLSDLDSAKRTLLESRPTAVSLWNGLHATVRGVEECRDPGDAASLVIANAARFSAQSLEAVETIGRIGAKRIRDGDTVMTHCNSSAALSVIKTAHSQGKDVKVFATESRPWRQGLLTVRDLHQAGVDTTLIIDSAVRTVMKRVDAVFVGADTITSHGALINKIGTSQLALAAKEARVQFYVCSETYKFSPMTIFGDMVTIEERGSGEMVREGEIPEGVKVFNPVFDSTPTEYIDAIITELGMMSPGSVYGTMVRMLGERALRAE